MRRWGLAAVILGEMLVMLAGAFALLQAMAPPESPIGRLWWN
ncbi:MAG: hypothetical protein WBQ94_04355 [Terracidiphilus sp.]